MLILNDMEQFAAPGCVVALGTFDGVHRGHARLINEAVDRARRMNLPSAVLTFDRHPLSLIRPEAVPPALNTLAEKRLFMERLGLDVLIEQPFTPEFASLSPEDFLTRLCRALHPAAIVTGYNHSFGRKGQGNADTLRGFAAAGRYEPVILPPVLWNGEVVSSTKIRLLLAENRRIEAEAMAGHPLGTLSPDNRVL